jgi:hypothetical protein
MIDVVAGAGGTGMSLKPLERRTWNIEVDRYLRWQYVSDAF